MKKRTKFLVTGSVVSNAITPTVTPVLPKDESSPIKPGDSDVSKDTDNELPEAQIIEPIINGEWEMEQMRRGALLAEQNELRRGGDPYSLDLELKKKKILIHDEDPEQEQPETEQPIIEQPQQPTNTWTLLGVTMKKSWWLFVGGALALLFLTIVTLSITKKQ